MNKKLFFFLFIAHFFFQSQNSVSANYSTENWQGWRGFEKEGRNEFSDAPKKWSSEKNILWKTAIPGKGHSSPVVSGKNVIVTTAYHTTKNKFNNKFISFFIIVLIIILLLLYMLFIFRVISRKIILTIQQTFTIWAFSLSFGFILYFSLTGIIFHIEDNADHITQSIRWFFSGMIVSLCLMLATYSISYTLRNRITLIIISLIFSAFLIFFRPAPEYYTLTGDGSLVKTIFNAELILGLIIIIICISLFLKINSTARQNFNFPDKTSVFSKILLLLSITGTFFLGMFGITIYKLFRFPIPAGDFTLPVIDVYYRDSNVFTGIIFICLVLWATFFIINSRLSSGKVLHENFYKSHWFASGIIILAILIFIRKNYLTIENEFVRAVICIDTDSGKIKWTREVFMGFQATLHHDNSPASPTPIITDNHIYAYFGTPGLLCTDTSGNILWQNTELPFEDIHGIGASPMYCNGLIIILNDMPKAPYITAIDSKTGKIIWHTKRKPWKGFHGSHRTPLIKKINGKDIIITWGYYGLNIYDAVLGKELINYPLDNSIGQLVASIISNGDTIFAPDRDKFHAFSLTKLIQRKEPEIWTVNMNRKGPVCSSPVLFKNMLFMISDNGFAHCLDAAKGKILWKEKLNGIFMSSCTLIGENVYFNNTSGQTTVIAADKKFRKISENKLPEPVYASPAPFNNQIFIRTTEYLYCIKEK